MGVIYDPILGALRKSDVTDTSALVLKAGDTMTGKLQINVPTATSEALILKTTDNNATKNLLEVQSSAGTVLNSINSRGVFSVNVDSLTGSSFLIRNPSNLSTFSINALASGSDSYSGFGLGTEWNGSQWVVRSVSGDAMLFYKYPGSFQVTGQTGLANGSNWTNADPSIRLWYGDLATHSSSFGGTTTSARVEIIPKATTNQGLIVKGVASQTANLQEWQNSAGTVLSSIDSLGGALFQRSTNSTTAFRVLQADATSVFNVDTTNGRVGIGTASPGAKLQIDTTAAVIGTIIKGAVSQTANLTEWQNSAGTILSATNALGVTGTVQKAITLGVGVTTFAVTSNVMTITGDAGANTIATITGGVNGQLLTLIFVDALVTITDTGAATANTANLSAAFTGAANTTMQLVYDGNKWFETSRSVN